MVTEFGFIDGASSTRFVYTKHPGQRMVIDFNYRVKITRHRHWHLSFFFLILNPPWIVQYLVNEEHVSRCNPKRRLCQPGKFPGWFNHTDNQTGDTSLLRLYIMFEAGVKNLCVFVFHEALLRTWAVKKKKKKPSAPQFLFAEYRLGKRNP